MLTEEINGLFDNIGKEIKEKKIEIIGKDAPSKVSFDQKVKTKKYKEKSSVEDWNNLDFAKYLLKLYYNRYDTSWDIKPVGISMRIPEIKQKIQDIIGHVSNTLLKDYFDFFFIKFADSYKQKSKGIIYISSLKEEKPLKYFLERYNKASFNKKENKVEDNIHDLEKVFVSNYQLGIENFILEYGIIATSYWLNNVKKIDKDTLFAVFKEKINKINKNNNIKKVFEATIKYSPYLFKNNDLTSKIVNYFKEITGIEINVEFKNKNSILNFLKEND